MKKQTVLNFLLKVERETRKHEDEHIRKALLDATRECRSWVGLPWADMNQPVTKQMKEIEQEAETLIGKRQKLGSLNEAEQARLDELAALYHLVYHPFQKKIQSTVLRAQVERKVQVKRLQSSERSE